MGEKVFIVGPHRQAHDLLNPLWSDLQLEKHRFTSAEAALGMMQGEAAPSAILISYPLWDSSLDDLLATMMRILPSDQPVPVVVLAPENALFEVAIYEDQGVTVLSEGRQPEELRQAVVDYRATQFGGWPWNGPDPVHDRREGRFALHADGKVEHRNMQPAAG